MILAQTKYILSPQILVVNQTYKDGLHAIHPVQRKLRCLLSKDTCSNWIFPEHSTEELTYRTCLAASSTQGTILNTRCSSDSSWGWSRGWAAPFLIHSNISFSSKSKSLSTTSPTFTSKSTAANKKDVEMRSKNFKAVMWIKIPKSIPRKPNLAKALLIPEAVRLPPLFNCAYLPSFLNGGAIGILGVQEEILYLKLKYFLTLHLAFKWPPKIFTWFPNN